MKLNVHKLEKFSFKDILAIAFVGVFLHQVYLDKERMVDLLVPLVSIILGGYFVSEGYSYYMDKQRKDTYENNGNEPPV